MSSAPSSEIGTAFADPVMDSQRSFRSILAAMAEPGSMQRCDVPIEAPAGVSTAALVAALTLVDQETPVWMGGGPSERVLRYLRFHTGCPLARDRCEAMFAILGPWSPAFAIEDFPAGDERYPDRSATLIIECQALTGGPEVVWAGPGIRGCRRVTPIPPFADFWHCLRNNSARYPLGVDILLVAGDEIMGLPRSTRVEIQPEAA